MLATAAVRDDDRMTPPIQRLIELPSPARATAGVGIAKAVVHGSDAG